MHPADWDKKKFLFYMTLKTHFGRKLVYGESLNLFTPINTG